MIFYIFESRNKIVDELFKTLFRFENCDLDDKINEALTKLKKVRFSRIQKNEKTKKRKNEKNDFQFFIQFIEYI